MNDINQVCFSGCLGKDAYVKATTDNQGQPATVFGFSIAVNKGKKDQYGNWVNVPNWIDCVYYTRLQNITLVKGEKVIVWGSMEQKTVTDQNGMEVKRLRVMVDRLEKPLLSGAPRPRLNQYQQPQQPIQRQAQPQAQQPRQAQPAPAQQYQQQNNAPINDGFDDVPF